jgi:hypothetical protein
LAVSPVCDAKDQNTSSTFRDVGRQDPLGD